MRRGRVLLVLLALGAAFAALGASRFAAADAAGAPAARTLADMLAHGRPIERLWAAYALARALPEDKQAILWLTGAAIEDAREAPRAHADAAEEDAKAPTVLLEMRHLEIPCARLPALDVAFAPVDAAPVAPGAAQRRRAPPYLLAPLDEAALARLEAEVAAGPVTLVGRGAARGPAGTDLVLEILVPGPAPMGAWPGRPETGAVAVFRADLDEEGGGHLWIRRVVVAKTPAGALAEPGGAGGAEENPCRPRVLLRGSAHAGRAALHRVGFAFRPGARYLLVPQWPVEGDWPRDGVPALEIALRIVEAGSPDDVSGEPPPR